MASSGGGELRQRETSTVVAPASVEEKKKGGKANVAKGVNVLADVPAIALLLLLYFLQGVPLGLISDEGIPLLLQRYGLRFKDFAVFSLASAPYMLKLLWAPAVDAMWVQSVGRRLSWILPAQLASGIVLLYFGWRVDDVLAQFGRSAGGSSVEWGSHGGLIWTLAGAFTMLTFLAATQDIAVDGWALTLLRPENKGLASVCNTLGMMMGAHASSTLLLAFTDADTSKAYLRRPLAALGLPVSATGGALLLPGTFFLAVGSGFLVLTLAIWLFVREAPTSRKHLRALNSSSPSAAATATTAAAAAGAPATPSGSPGAAAASPAHDVSAATHALWRSYGKILTILQVREVQVCALLLLTCRVAFAAMDAGSKVELVRRGVPPRFFAALSVAMVPVELVAMVFLARWLSGPSPLSWWLGAYVPRMVLSLVSLYLLSRLPAFAYSAEPWGLASPAGAGAPVDWLPYGVAALALAQRVLSMMMFSAQMSFFSRVADPSIGGTYMTLLNTITNLGSWWPRVSSLALMELLDDSGCYTHAAVRKTIAQPGVSLSVARWNAALHGMHSRLADAPEPVQNASCANHAALLDCVAKDGFCARSRDGFSTIVLASLALGLLWVLVAARFVFDIQAAPKEAWWVSHVDTQDLEDEDEDDGEGQDREDREDGENRGKEKK